MDAEHLFAPIGLVTFFELSLSLTDAHAIVLPEFGHAFAVVTIQALPHFILIDGIHLRRSHSYDTVVGVVVRSHKVLQCVDVARRLMFHHVSPHVRLQRSIEPFDDARLGLLVVSGKVMDAVLLQQTLHGSVQKTKSFIGLQHRWSVVGEQLV